MADHITPKDAPSRTASPGSANSSVPLGHRSSFAEGFRQSPRSQRNPSFTQANVQDLINHPPASKGGDPKFAGRDWRQICVGELVKSSDLHWAELDIDVEQATKDLIEAGPPNVLLLREKENARNVVSTFDYSDLNAYLLIVLGLANPEESQIHAFDELAKKAQDRVSISLREVLSIAKKEPLTTLSEREDLSKAVEIFGSGIHRILVCKEGTDDVVGILSQLKLVQFLWDNASSFPVIERLYPIVLQDLEVGAVQAVSINGDKPLTEVLQLMSDEGVTSVAVVDNAMNVVGNISTVDVKLLTTTSSLPLLKSSCIHFISVILSERGIGDGKDSFPVFHVNPYSTLAHTVAKLVATKSHRMWIVESASPSSSTPATPLLSHASAVSQGSLNSVSPTFPSVSAASLPGAPISGRLIGVISLSDILNLFARQSGLNPLSPNDMRASRRRSSSSSMTPMRQSTEFIRGSSMDIKR